MSSILKFLRENHILALIEQAINKKKSRLCLNSFEIYVIPDLLYSCNEIEHLYLHKNKISVIPVQICQLVNLTTLTLDYNNITSLPAEIGNLKNLVNLNISYNPLNKLIPEIGDLLNLEAFWCNRIGLQELPKELGKLEKLDTFGARGNQIKVIPDDFNKLTRLRSRSMPVLCDEIFPPSSDEEVKAVSGRKRISHYEKTRSPVSEEENQTKKVMVDSQKKQTKRWLTLENNLIEELPDDLDKMEGLVHCNMRFNNIKHFPTSLLKCSEIMYIQLSNNQISSLPETIAALLPVSMESVDLRHNPICELDHPEHPLLRYTEEQPCPTARSASASALAINALNGTVIRLPQAPRPELPRLADLEMDNSSIESSEDWENSVNSSELDVHYQSDEERVDNEAVGMVLPDLSRYASTAS